jgi:hypothetical protein
LSLIVCAVAQAKGNLIVAEREKQLSLDTRITARTRQALETYAAAVRQHLTEPLRAWALGCQDPLARNAGTELASVCGLVHQISPMIHELQGRSLESLLQGGPDVLPSGLFAQFLRLGERFGSLLRDLQG